MKQARVYRSVGTGTRALGGEVELAPGQPVLGHGYELVEEPFVALGQLDPRGFVRLFDDAVEELAKEDACEVR